MSPFCPLSWVPNLHLIYQRFNWILLCSCGIFNSRIFSRSLYFIQKESKGYLNYFSRIINMHIKATHIRGQLNYWNKNLTLTSILRIGPLFFDNLLPSFHLFSMPCWKSVCSFLIPSPPLCCANLYLCYLPSSLFCF